MDELDILVRDRFVPFRERLVEIFRSEHPLVITIMQAVLGGKKNKVGLRVTEGGQTVGEYTFHLNGINIADAERGGLESELNHPFLGVIRPYAIIEREALEKLIADEASFESDFFKTVAKHLPDLTVKFMS